MISLYKVQITALQVPGYFLTQIYISLIWDVTAIWMDGLTAIFRGNDSSDGNGEGYEKTAQ